MEGFELESLPNEIIVDTIPTRDGVITYGDISLIIN